MSWGDNPESVGTDGFCDAKRPAKRPLKLSGLEIYQVRLGTICIAGWEEPGFENNRISHLEIVLAARLIRFPNHLCLHVLQPLSQHAES